MFISPKTRFILLYVQFKIYNYLAEKLTKKGRITENLQALNAEINGGGGGVGGGGRGLALSTSIRALS